MDTSDQSKNDPATGGSAPPLGLPGSFPEALIESQTSLNRAVWDRRSDYTQSKTIRIKVGTWNVASTPGTEKDVGGWFVHGKGISEALSGLDVEESQDIEGVEEQERRRTPGQSTLPKNDTALLPKDKDIGLYVLGLQEIVDVSSPVEAMRPYHDRAPSERWKSAMLAALPKGYTLIAEQQLVGMYILIYAASHVASTISNVSCRAVGTGLMGYMGNKGATAVRLVIGETTRIVFVNSHLSAGAEKTNMDRRNWDSSQIIERTRFDALDHGHGVVDEVEEAIGDEDFCFWFGDLNYRLGDLPGHDIRRLLMLHTNKQYGKATRKDQLEITQNSETAPANDEQENSDAEIDPDQDPSSMQATIASLLPHDELHDQIRKKIAFYDGWQEGKIRFMPTYKYDVGSVGMFDTSEKRRAPSWCDRILYRTRKQYENYTRSESPKTTASQSQASGSSGSITAPSSSTSYEYDPDEDADEPGSDSVQEVTTKSGFEDKIELEYYTSHQRVLSSDHKPLNAVFQMTYQAVDPDKKALVYQEVAKDFDRHENESRPSLAVAVDTPEGKSTDEMIDYGDVRFDVNTSRTVTIANTGPISAVFSFAIAQPWLLVHCDADPAVKATKDSQAEYRISPGEALTATITIHISDPADTRKLNSNPSSVIEDVVILRVSGGRDHFLTIRGRWLKTSFGMSMNELIRTPEEGIRQASAVIGGEDVKWSAPRELFKLTEALEAGLERAVAEWGMTGNEGKMAPWEDNGWPFQFTTRASNEGSWIEAVRHVRDALDTNQQLDPGAHLNSTQKVEVFAEVLMHFLDSLQDGIVSEALWTWIRDLILEWEKSKKKPDDDSKRVAILEIMSTSTPHNVSFTLIMVMLKRISGEIAAAGTTAEQNKRKKVQTAHIEVMQRLLFRPKDDGNADKESKRNVARRSLILELFVGEGMS